MLSWKCWKFQVSIQVPGRLSSDTPPKVGILGQNFGGTSSLQFNLAAPYFNRCVSAVYQPVGLFLQSLIKKLYSNVQRLPVGMLLYTQTIM